MDAPEKKPDHHKASSSSSSRRHEPMDTSDDSTPTVSGSSTRHASASSGTPKQSRESRKASTSTAAAGGASSSASSSSQTHQQQPHIEYGCVGELVHEFRQCMRDPRNVDTAAEYLYDSLLDEMVLGVAFEMHYSHRTGILQALEGQAEDPRQNALVSNGGPDIDVFGANCTKIAMDCTCPKCDRSVAAARFAPHLEKCMGMGRISSRIASRRLASTRDGGGNYFGSVQSDDEDDADWSGEKRKKKVQPVRTNGSKKNGRSSS